MQKRLYAWNPSICACECDKDCKTGILLKNCTCKKSLVDYLEVTCDQVVDTAKTAPINSTNKTNYRLLFVVLLAISYLLLLLIIAVKCSLKPNNIKIDEKSNKDVLIYNVGYVTPNSVRPLYLIINKTNGYVEENNEIKYFTLTYTDESKDKLKKYDKLWSKIKDLFRPTNNNSNNK